MKNDRVKKRILSHISHHTGEKHIDLDRTFNDYDIDSITSLELMMDLERDFNISIPEEKMEQLTTPRAVIEMVETLLTLHVR